MIKEEEDIKLFKTTHTQMFQMYKEISEMSKKKPDGPINQFKLTLINKIINDANSIIGDGYKPFDHFDNFDQDDLPTNSDIVIILSQYRSAMEQFKRDNIKKTGYNDWYWIIDGKLSEIKSSSP